MTRTPDFSLRGFFYPVLPLLVVLVFWVTIGRFLPWVVKLIVAAIVVVGFRFGHRMVRR